MNVHSYFHILTFGGYLWTFIQISMFLPLVYIYERSFIFPCSYLWLISDERSFRFLCSYLWWISMNVHSYFHVLSFGGYLWTFIHISMFLPLVDIYERSFRFPCSYRWWISINVHSYFHALTFGGYQWTVIHISMFLLLVDIY